MIFKDSRYASGNITKEYNAITKQYPVVVYRNFPIKKVKFYFYVWKESDRVDIVARIHMGYSHLWWKLMDYNPEIGNPFNILPGTVLRIPSA